MTGWTSLEVYNSIFNIAQENNNFKLYTDAIDKFSFTEIKDELEENLDVSSSSHEHIQDKIIGPRNIKAFKILKTEKKQIDGYFVLSMGYARSPIRDFEFCLRMVVGLDEDNIQMILEENNSFFVTDEIPPSFYSIKDISEAVYTMGGHEKPYKSNKMILAWKPNLFKLLLWNFWNFKIYWKNVF